MEQSLGKRIVSNRKRIGLTQDQLAEHLGVTAQAVSKWENDQSCPDITILPKLAQIFSISIDELLGHEAPQPAHEAEIVTDNEPKGVHIQKGNWEFQWNNGRNDGVTFAFLVLLVGVLTFLSRYFEWGVSFWSILWPCALLVCGFGSLLHKFRFFSLGCALFGGYFLVSNLNLFSLSLDSGLIFPLIIILFGLSLMVDSFRKPKKPTFRMSHPHGSDHKSSSSFHQDGESFESSASFAEKTEFVSLSRLSYGTASVSFGSMTLDLQQCEEIAPDCTIDLTCSFGELSLLVPKCYAVKDNFSANFGNIEYEGHPDESPISVIHLTGGCTFGSITIRYI